MSTEQDPPGLTRDAGITAAMGRIVTAAKAVDLLLIDIPQDIAPAIADAANELYATAWVQTDTTAVRWLAAACEGIAETLHQLADDRIRAAHDAAGVATGERG